VTCVHDMYEAWDNIVHHSRRHPGHSTRLPLLPSPRQGDKAFAYSWSATANKWEPVGEVVDSAGDSGNSVGGGKQVCVARECGWVVARARCVVQMLGVKMDAA
jgi:hypothetical protein